MWTKCTDGKTLMVCGGVAKDAEYRQVGQNNSSLTTFSVKNGEETLSDGTTKSTWTNCECWHSVARYAKDIKKGDTVLAIGILKTDTWTDKETGEQKSAKKLVCDYVAILPLTASSASASPAKPQTAPSDLNAQNAVIKDPVIDDYPF